MFSANNYVNACAREFHYDYLSDIGSPESSGARDRYIARLCLRALLPSSDRHFGLIARYMPRLATLRLTSRLASRNSNVGPASQFYTRLPFGCTHS